MTAGCVKLTIFAHVNVIVSETVQDKTKVTNVR